MTTPLLNIHSSSESPEPVVTKPLAAPQPPAWRNWLREPLLHFVLLGGLLFALDHFLVSRTDDPHLIVVGSDTESEAVQLFEAARGHKPNAEELEALRRAWLDNEVLYREGLALQVDRGDTAIRERVIFKALSVIDSGVKLPHIDENGLRQWFEAHRNKYDEPARYDFEEAALSGETTEASVKEFVDALKSGTPGDAKAGLRVFKGRPHENLVQSYGAELAEALVKAPVGQWQALRTKDGWRAMKLNSTSPPQPANFETLRGVVLQDWTDATASEQRSAAVRALTKKYTVKYEARDTGSAR